MTVPDNPDPGAPEDFDDERADTDPMMNSANPYGAGWGAGWGASWADAPEPNATAPDPPPAERTPAPTLGEVELPSATASFAFPTQPARSTGSVSGRQIALVVGGLAALAAIIGLVFWSINRSPSATEATDAGDSGQVNSPAASTTADTTTRAARDAGAEASLVRMLPPGYPPAACRPVDPQQGAVATVTCDGNVDPGGPPSATYLLLRDRPALDAAFVAAVRPDAVVTCPGNIQSPGPWRRNATPQKVSGTLVCGVQDGVPTLAWTDTERMLVGVVRSDSPGPTLDQLYQWWSSHS
ncbi:MAG: hypothetical protein U0R18_15285 [Mycobacterium sp.]